MIRTILNLAGDIVLTMVEEYHRHKDEDKPLETGTGYNKSSYSTDEPSGGAYDSGYKKTSYTDDQSSGGGYGTDEPSGGGYGGAADEYADTKITGGYGGDIERRDEVDYKKEEKHRKHLEHLGELGAAASGIYALYEKHKAKKDSKHAHRHKMEEEVAAAAAVRSAAHDHGLTGKLQKCITPAVHDKF